MAYKQNFGPSRKSGKAMSMCGVSRIMSPLDAKDWIADATKNSKGQFKAKAEKAGMSTAAYANKVIKENKGGKLEKQAHLAKTLMGLSRTESPLNKEVDFSNFVLDNNMSVQTGDTNYSSPQRYDVDFGEFESPTITGTGSIGGGSDESDDDSKQSSGTKTRVGRLNAKKKAVEEGGGNEAKEARIKGRIDRTEKRQSERAKRIKKRNKNRLDRVTKRQESKTKDGVFGFLKKKQKK